MKPRNLYVHAPFCARRCSYCDFAVTVSSAPPVEPWAAAIGRELEGLAAARGWTGPLELETLYIGGGTPSLLGVGALERLRKALGERVSLGHVQELTAEANPESFTPDLAADWRRAGVNRLSLGAQTFHEPALRWMGRMHGPAGPGRAVATARAAGIDNIGLDLIFGLPERLDRELDHDLDRVLALEADHVSVYGLSVEKGTPLGRRVEEGREAVADPERYRDEYLRVVERLTTAGYEHYEVSNFARPGRRSRHNSAYWTGVPYVGLGNGAHSYIAPERWWNHRDWLAYRQAVERGESPRAADERLDAAETRLESIWLGLRTDRGLDRAVLGEAERAKVAEWDRRGLTEADRVRVRLSPEGWLLLDRLAVELDGAAPVAAA